MLDNYTIHFYLSFVLAIVRVLQTKYVAELLKVQEQSIRLISSVFFSTLIFCTQSTVQSEANQDFFFLLSCFSWLGNLSWIQNVWTCLDSKCKGLLLMWIRKLLK